MISLDAAYNWRRCSLLWASASKKKISNRSIEIINTKKQIWTMDP
jgi:hypothetical protein